MTSAFIILLYISLPFLCILAIPPASRPGAVAERIVFGIALYEFLLLGIGLLLGLTNHLTVPVYLAVTCLAASLLIVQSFRNGVHFDLFPFGRYCQTRRGALALLMAFLVAVTFALELGFGALYGNRHGDALWYHIPRVIFWVQNHNFDPWTTPVAAQVGLPIGADLILAQKILLGKGWYGVGFVTCMLACGSIACIYLAALDLRLSRWHAAMSALLFASFPTIGLRIWSVNSDIAAAFPVLASYVALHRIRDIKIGLAAFLLLNGIAISCKPTVAPLAVLLGCVTLWQCRHKIITLRSFFLPCAATLLASSLVLSSYWPVYMAFSDFLGGDYSRAHKTKNITEFLHAVLMHTGHWLLEPLGYLTRFKESWEIEAVKSVYNFLGANFERLPDIWKPYPGQSLGYTGLVSVLALPVLFAGLSSKVRIQAALLFLLAYIPLSGMILPQPFFVRYNVVLLAGYALLWGGTNVFRRGNRRWILIGIVALNVCALLGVVVIDIYEDVTQWSQPGHRYYYISKRDRQLISSTLKGRPLLVVTGGELESLLLGPQITFPLRYVICPADGNWEKRLRVASHRSVWLALVHNGEKSIIPGPIWKRPTSHVCSEVSTHLLEDEFMKAGWTRYKSNDKVDLWRFASPPE